MLGYNKILLNENCEWLVFLHGFGGDSSLFYKQVDFFSKHYNLLLVDFPGHGKSIGLNEKKYTSERIAKEVVELLNHLSIPKAHLVAFSLGTVIANALISLNPEKVKTLTLVGPVLKWSWWSDILVKGAYEIRNFAPYMPIYTSFAYLMMPKKNHNKSRVIFIEEAKKLGRLEYIKWSHLFMKPEQTYLNSFKNQNGIPKLYAIGREDHMFFKEAIKASENDKNSTLKIIKGSGHVCFLEKSQETNESIHEFIKLFLKQENDSFLKESIIQ